MRDLKNSFCTENLSRIWEGQEIGQICKKVHWLLISGQELVEIWSAESVRRGFVKLQLYSLIANGQISIRSHTPSSIVRIKTTMWYISSWIVFSNWKKKRKKNIQLSFRNKIGTYLKNNCLVLSVNVMPCWDTLKCTTVGVGNGFLEYKNVMAFRIASGPVSDSVSHVNKYRTLHAAPCVINCCWAGEW